MAKNNPKNNKTAKSTTQTQSNIGVDLLDDSDLLREKILGADGFVQKNRFLLITLTAVVVLSVGGYLFYNYLSAQQEKQAQDDMFAAVYYLEADSLNKAIKGDGNYSGLEEIADNYTLSKASNLSRFYLGVALLKKGKYEEAIASLENFSASDLLVQSRAYSLIADANMELGRYEEAVKYYSKAINHKPNKSFTPQYLMKLAVANEKNKNLQAAIDAYSKLIDTYPASPDYINAKKYKAQLEQSLKAGK
ncbi:MAG: tetratricopeptide repeat protein [Cytophagales bacterium]|nr:MAG: tetratricopeptide repeat protein [Cytophagales bacterium]